jgi:hypothetical protein
MRLFLAASALFVCLAGYILTLLLDQPVTGPLSQAEIASALALPPVQTATTRLPFAYKEFRLTPRAEYAITARVFSTRRYHWNFIDRFYLVAPEDLAVGWGQLSDYKNRDILHIRQEDRFFKYRWRGAPPYPPEIMIASMANNHIVPATSEMAARLGQVRPGDIVHMEGALVDISDPGHGTIATSLTRTDTGFGACEILYLEELQIERE